MIEQILLLSIVIGLKVLSYLLAFVVAIMIWGWMTFIR